MGGALISPGRMKSITSSSSSSSSPPKPNVNARAAVTSEARSSFGSWGSALRAAAPGLAPGLSAGRAKLRQAPFVCAATKMRLSNVMLVVPTPKSRSALVALSLSLTRLRFISSTRSSAGSTWPLFASRLSSTALYRSEAGSEPRAASN